jgi:hypothetical protein
MRSSYMCALSASTDENASTPLLRCKPYASSLSCCTAVCTTFGRAATTKAAASTPLVLDRNCKRVVAFFSVKCSLDARMLGPANLLLFTDFRYARSLVSVGSTRLCKYKPRMSWCGVVHSVNALEADGSLKHAHTRLAPRAFSYALFDRTDAGSRRRF